VVYIYEQASTGVWDDYQRLSPQDDSNTTYYGASLAMDARGLVLAVGRPLYPESTGSGMCERTTEPFVDSMHFILPVCLSISIPLMVGVVLIYKRADTFEYHTIVTYASSRYVSPHCFMHSRTLIIVNDDVVMIQMGNTCSQKNYFFGSSLKLTDDASQMVVGSVSDRYHQDQTKMGETSRVTVIHRGEDDLWSMQNDLQSSPSLQSSALGFSVDISGNGQYIAAGAIRYDHWRGKVLFGV